MEKNGIQIYQLPDCDEDEDEEYKEQCRQLKVRGKGGQCRQLKVRGKGGAVSPTQGTG